MMAALQGCSTFSDRPSLCSSLKPQTVPLKFSRMGQEIWQEGRKNRLCGRLARAARQVEKGQSREEPFLALS